jgi:hypothetical protein
MIHWGLMDMKSLLTTIPLHRKADMCGWQDYMYVPSIRCCKTAYNPDSMTNPSCRYYDKSINEFWFERVCEFHDPNPPVHSHAVVPHSTSLGEHSMLHLFREVNSGWTVMDRKIDVWEAVIDRCSENVLIDCKVNRSLIHCLVVVRSPRASGSPILVN